MAFAKHPLAVAMMVTVLVISAGFQSARAADEDPMQDFCVALPAAAAAPVINGKVCKAPEDTVVADFTSALLALAANTNNRLKATVTPLNVNNFPGLNTQGLAGARLDFAVGGLNPPHLHPRASELLFLITGGPLEVSFITTANALFTTTIKAGEVFILPRGLLHFQRNRGTTPALAISAFNSQNPGTQQAGAALFGVTPPIGPDVLQQALNVGPQVVQQLLRGQKSTVTPP